MNTNKQLSPLSATALSLSILMSQVSFCYQDSFLKNSHEHYINSFGMPDPVSNHEEKIDNTKLIPFIKTLFKPSTFKTTELSDHEKRELAHKATASLQTNDEVIDASVINKMEIVKGEGSPLENIATRLTDSYQLVATHIGRQKLVEMLCQPIHDIAIIKQRQAILKELVSNPALLEKCMDTLATLKGVPESHLLTLFKEENGVNADLFKKVYWQKPWTKLLNKSSATLEAGTRLSNLGTVAATCTLPGLIGFGLYKAGNILKKLHKNISPWQAAHYLWKGNSSNTELEIDYNSPYVKNSLNVTDQQVLDSINLDSKMAETGIHLTGGDYKVLERQVFEAQRAEIRLTNQMQLSGIHEGYKNWPGVTKGWKKLPSHLKTLIGFYSTLYAGIYTLGSLVSLANARINKNILNYMQEYLIGTSTCVRSIQALHTNLADNPVFAQTEIVENLRSCTGTNANKSSEFNDLINQLTTRTFQGNASFFSISGRILRCHDLMKNENIRNEFGNVLAALGELDALIAIAQKIRQHNGNEISYCFVDFVESDQPLLNATQCWCPLVNPNKAVANDVHLGADGMGNIILTGPNTGGKSTLLKSIMTNALLAQTFGIASAQHLEMTPFAKLSCHMNITDDTAGGVSLFKAEINRAQELITMVRTLPKDQFAFIIIDEIFTGTAPDKAEDLSYKFIKQLSEFPNVVFVDATHFSKLTQMEHETNGKCQNYHMGVITNDEGKVIKYTYKLVPGSSPINNAQQIADEEGIF